MRPCILLEQFAWMDSIGRKLISRTSPISIKKRMDELTLRDNLLRKKPGKSRMKMSDYLPHEMGGHRVCGVYVHVFKNFLCKSNLRQVTIVLVTMLLQICWFACWMFLWESMKERSLLKHKRNGFFPFRIKHGMLNRLLGEREVHQHVR